MNTDMHDVKELPYLVPRKVFLQVSGLSVRTLRTLVESGEVRRWVPPRPQRRLLKGLYYREDLVRLVGRS